MACRKWFRNNGKWLKSHDRNPRTLEPGGATFKFGNGNIAEPLGLARKKIRTGGRWDPMEISIFAARVPNFLACLGLASLGAVIDASCNVPEMSARLPTTRVA